MTTVQMTPSATPFAMTKADIAAQRQTHGAQCKEAQWVVRLENGEMEVMVLQMALTHGFLIGGAQLLFFLIAVQRERMEKSIVTPSCSTVAEAPQ